MAGGASFSEDSLAGDGGDNSGAGAGAEFLTSGFTADVTDSEQVERFQSGAARLKEMASNGQFAINEEGMRRYLKAIDLFLDGYKDQELNLRQLTQRAKLGSSPFAMEVADHNVKVIDGDEQSLIPNLEKMKAAFEDAREALLAARRNYDETEEAYSMTFRNMGLD
ncbi:hypothetical protein SAMN06265360_114140 [Haloechinothrix alba]|uniref:Excreted virulence factor EspC, type VII ESX diderm n=1 Tax=Haloechinothrix alba TaxID=664784 RepID=A0A238YD58_9PSEU|nr:hypothetical protein [Haloechinothrix alba]SNR68748.1 hypothetical protein SAMN06265360_114140 [Haloechinothrix alba]